MIHTWATFFKSLFTLGLLSLSCAQMAIANENPAEIKDETEFFSIVNETGGYINHDLHSEFWVTLKRKYNDEQRKEIVNDIQNTLDILKAFQAKTWQTAKESYQKKQVTTDAEFENLKSKLVQHPSHYFSPKIIVENSEKIIAASASRNPLDLGAGKFYITPEIIDENMVGIKGSHERLRLLISPEWKDEYKEYALPVMQISLLALYPPDEYHEVISHFDEKIDIHIAQLCVAKNAIYELGSVDYQKGDKKFVDFTPEEREIYIQEFVKEQMAGYKIMNPMLSKGSWRDFNYAKAIGSMDDYNIIIMSLFVNSKALYIKYVTNGNLSVAGADFNEFTKRIQIVEKQA